ncbi:hypothetical protein TL16_g05229 [Triparma laevis f. inornata]|uniref:Calmodulin n=1 Tax=Triparma laevis f. inornata TaxID=1714386 RepID=A0A9W7E995_9STRA|nr:hypothetical protein TL16_g05229 [Triparma laevis f. inornata]
MSDPTASSDENRSHAAIRAALQGTLSTMGLLEGQSWEDLGDKSETGERRFYAMSITEEDVKNGLADRASRVSIGVRRRSNVGVLDAAAAVADHVKKAPSNPSSNYGGNYGAKPKNTTVGGNYGAAPKSTTTVGGNYGAAPKSTATMGGNYGATPKPKPEAAVKYMPLTQNDDGPETSSPEEAQTEAANPSSTNFHDFASPPKTSAPPVTNTYSPSKSGNRFSMAGPPRLSEIATEPASTPKGGARGNFYSSPSPKAIIGKPTTPNSRASNVRFSMLGPPKIGLITETPDKPGNNTPTPPSGGSDDSADGNNNNTNKPKSSAIVPSPGTPERIPSALRSGKSKSPSSSPIPNRRTTFTAKALTRQKEGGGATSPNNNQMGVRAIDQVTIIEHKQKALQDSVEKRKKMAREAFELIDIDHDGFLTKEEVLKALQSMNKAGVTLIPATMEMVENMMKEVDEDGDGQIDLDEFANMMVNSAQLLGRQKSGFKQNNDAGRMSVLARNVLLAHERVTQKDNTIGNDYWMIHPHDWKHAFWDVVVSVLILITVVTMPLSLGWECFNVELYEVNLLIDALFMMDVVKNFCTGFIDSNESIIMDQKLVWWNYGTGYFLIDLLSSFPIDPILDMYDAGDEGEGVGCDAVNTGDSGGGSDSIVKATKGLKMLKLLRMAKLFRLLRLSRVFRYIKMAVMYLEEKAHIRVSDGFTKLIKLGIGVLLICHWIGSFNFMICRLHEFPEDSWVVHSDLVGEPASTQWSWSFFKALAMMIMIGFETPPFTNVSCDTRSDWCCIENWITLGCLYIGAVFYSLLISSVASILNSANMSSRIFEERLNKLDDYMRSQKLPAALREKVKDHFHMQHSDGKLFDEDEVRRSDNYDRNLSALILGNVTPLLRREIVGYKNREILLKVPFFDATHDDQIFSTEVACHLSSEIVFMNEIVVREDTSGDTMFFIFSGVVEIFLQSTADLTYVAIGDGCYFGEVSILLNCKRTASARTKTQCMLFRMKAQDLRLLLHDFPEKEEYMKRVARARHKRIVAYMGVEEGKEPDDEEQDEEDAKTDLFGTDADEMMLRKDEEFEKYRQHARISVRASHHRNSGVGLPGRNGGSSRRKSSMGKMEASSLKSISEFRNRNERSSRNVRSSRYSDRAKMMSGRGEDQDSESSEESVGFSAKLDDPDLERLVNMGSAAKGVPPRSPIDV